MKIGNLDIKKAFLGSLPLTSKNAYIGNYKVISGDEPIQYDGLTFTAEEANSTIKLSQNGKPSKYPTYDLETSTDGKTWNTYTIGDVITLVNIGDKVYWRGNNTAMAESMNIYKYFVMTGKIGASGNTNSLLEKENYETITSLQDYCYTYTFKSCTSLTTAPELPATTLGVYCYYRLFYGCTSLTTAPSIIPATTIPGNSCSYMFNGCISLTTAPELPATTLTTNSYQYMFGGCTSLTTAPSVLPATTLGTNCYNNMFSGCTSLTTAPELLATTISSLWCCTSMFYNCSKLKEVTIYATSWNTTNADKWLSDVASSGTLYNLGGATDIPTDSASGCPTGWTIKTTKP